MTDPVADNLPSTTPTPADAVAAMPPAAGDAVVRILLVEDDEDDFILTRDLLAEIPTARFQLEWVGRYEQGLEAMRANRHDVYLVDYRLGARTGLDLLGEARDAGCEAPVILLTGQHDVEIDLAAMRAGAADYLVKGQIAAPLLERSIRYSLAQHRTLTALRHREEQLRHAQKMEAIGRLAGGVAHDFNNVLTAVMGYTDLVLERIEDRPDAPAVELTNDVREIRRAAHRATSLTRQLLTFSRRQGSEIRVLSLGRVIGELESMLRRLIGADIELVARVEPGVPHIKADRGQLEQVIMNLTVNARDAMPDGGRLTIAARDVVAHGGDDPWHPGVAPGRYALLTVADTGTGMDDQTLARMFEPFFTTKGPDKGTGLGLSTVYAIVSGSGGHTRVESYPGRGTSFYIYLPASPDPCAAEEDDEKAGAGSRRAAPAAPYRDSSETLLLVEDQDVVRKLVRRLLQADGYTVLEARDGREAMGICATHPGPIELMVTDLNMPQMGGQELAREAVRVRPALKVLFISGFSADEAGVCDESIPGLSPEFLQKPFNPVELARKIRKVLDAPPGNGRGA